MKFHISAGAHARRHALMHTTVTAEQLGDINPAAAVALRYDGGKILPAQLKKTEDGYRAVRSWEASGGKWTSFYRHKSKNPFVFQFVHGLFPCFTPPNTRGFVILSIYQTKEFITRIANETPSG